MAEAATIQSPVKLRDLFAILISTCAPSEPAALWEKHKDNMTEDFLYQARREIGDENINFSDTLYNKVLILLEDKVLAMVGKTLKELGLPEPDRADCNRMSKESRRIAGICDRE